jgi:hypothetical protein
MAAMMVAAAEYYQQAQMFQSWLLLIKIAIFEFGYLIIPKS